MKKRFCRTNCATNCAPQRARRVRNWVSTSVSPLPTGTVCRVSTVVTAAVTQCKTKDVASAAAEGAPLMGIQTNDPRITLVAGGYPLFVDGKIVGAIGVGGGTEAQDCEIAEHVVSVFESFGD